MKVGQLFTVGGFIAVHAYPQDCSVAVPWEAKVYAGGAMEDLVSVHLDNVMYTQKWYASKDDVPGVTGLAENPWENMGDCIAGTAGAGPQTGSSQQIDCTNVEPWIGKSVYANMGAQAAFEGKVWQNKYWTQASAPGHPESDPNNTNGDDPWEQVSVCTPGTEPEAPPLGLGETMDRILCSCCKGCADLDVIGPICKDTVEYGNCYFTECRDINNFDQDACDAMVTTQQYMYYPGEVAAPTAPWPAKVYAPYVDSGLYPYPKLAEISRETGVKHFVLAFVQSGALATVPGCQGGFASVIPVKQGPIAWNMDAQKNDYLYDDLNELRAMGGDITISFGGASGVELADSDACNEGDAVTNLVNAYSEVIDFLKLNHIDFDIEGAAASSTNRERGWKNRFAAVKQLKEKYQGLQVWWTLPVLPDGLVLDGQTFVSDLVDADVPMDMLNIMTMDYGDDTICPGNKMGPCERSAVEALANYVFNTISAKGKLAQYGITSLADTYKILGSTPMIGVNDVNPEHYLIMDAQQSLAEWKTNKPLGLVSNWSLNRDDACKMDNMGKVDLGCTGIPDQTEKYQFAKIFNAYTSA